MNQTGDFCGVALFDAEASWLVELVISNLLLVNNGGIGSFWVENSLIAGDHRSWA